MPRKRLSLVCVLTALLLAGRAAPQTSEASKTSEVSPAGGAA